MMKKILLLGVACSILSLAVTACKSTKNVTETTVNTATKSSYKRIASLPVLPDSLLNGEWLFLSAMGKPVVGDKTVNIIIDTKSHRIYGDNGCNVFNGTLNLATDGVLSFSDCITTLIACRPDVTDNNVMQALAATSHYVITKHTADELKIDLMDNNGVAVATLSRQLRELLAGHWDIVEVDGKEINIERVPSVVLDIAECRITGNSGCNLLNGSIEYNDATVNNGIRFVDVASTRRMCEPAVMQVEDRVLEALNRVDAFRFLDDNRIALYTIPSATNLLVLKRK